RKNLMRDHGSAMRRLSLMFDGRGGFDRREATKLARTVEAGAGENLWRLYAPGSVAPGSRATPWMWEDFDSFKNNAEALKTAAGDLADALEKRPTADDYAEGRAWVPAYPHGLRGPWDNGEWGADGGGLTRDALDRFDTLADTCTACHVNYRFPRW
ncbi:MAG: cytochrome c, partial [Alphaproteobacteria bacterium]|nr:cytochrome c [Alphaproteobacteria bacterium]